LRPQRGEGHTQQNPYLGARFPLGVFENVPDLGTVLQLLKDVLHVQQFGVDFVWGEVVLQVHTHTPNTHRWDGRFWGAKTNAGRRDTSHTTKISAETLREEVGLVACTFWKSCLKTHMSAW
jgi:hypothetical protein